ncbi:ImmA/IrrE family metallo-endopeptidase [Sphingobium sp.]|uniref:ImmA/IrrE family metallo-endopeptidase n=1 Tax=Sphingobium sp. TaxID=1912891 RepID=UPI0028BD50CC|nr:ImmA/IrrE family metallo-endopeptidase [Sphingobium sp.]
MPNDAFLNDLANGGSAETLLATILKYHPDLRAPIDVVAIAHRAGITEVRDLETDAFASALITNMAKGEAAILCAPGLSAQRRRFAIAHQLGHFLLGGQPVDRQCRNRDLAETRRDTPTRKAEMHANRFAAGVLMPKPLFVASVAGLGKPTVTHLPDIAATYHVTLEAAVTRYADLTQTMCAFLFVKDGVLRYARPSRFFPALSIQAGDPIPASVKSATPNDRIAWLPAEARDWIQISRHTRQPRLTMQILSKANGFQLVMLFVNAAAERRADEEAEKEATEKPSFGQRR